MEIAQNYQNIDFNVNDDYDSHSNRQWTNINNETYITNPNDRNGKFTFLGLDIRGLTRNPKYSK